MRTRSLAFLLVLALSACGAPPSTSTGYTAPASIGGRMCVNQCNEAKTYCSEDCDLIHRQCVTKIQAQALIDYQKYMNDTLSHSETIDLRARDFERTAPCDDKFKSCNNDCESHHQQCYENCGGKVETITSCQFLCF